MNQGGDIDEDALLFHWVSSNESDALEKYLALNPHKSSVKNEEGISLSMWAMYNRLPTLAATIYAYLEDPDPEDVVVLNDAEKLERYLDADPELVEYLSSDGYTLLQLACFFSHLDSVNVLIDAGASLNYRSQNSSQVCPIHSAVASQSLEVVKLLLDQGADVNVQQRGGITPLMSAAAKNNRNMIDLLLEHGADISMRDDDGKIAYQYGASNGFEIAKLIVT